MKKRRYDVPALYDPNGIYGKCNWRALLVLIVTIVPMMPALANRVSPTTVSVPNGLKNLFAINWLYGFFMSLVLYAALNLVWPHKQSLIPHTIHGTPISAVEVDEEAVSGSSSQEEKVLPNKVA